MRTEEPRAIHLADYTAPEFRIVTVHLDFALEPEATRVTARLEIERVYGNGPLVLAGEAQELLSVTLDGAAVDYHADAHALTIARVPDRFTLEIVSRINPAANTALEGLFLSNGMFCTQCEPEGFRRITYFLDRPDNLSVFTVRIEADKEQYPVLLSNGNRIAQGELPGGRHFAEWHDPFPKPSYLFALVAGDLGAIHDRFTTLSGRDVELAIYVEHGNEPRAHYALDSLKRAMAWDEQAYGREYDLDIFMIVAVSAFNMGAMENKGLNIFNDKVLLASPETATDDDYARIESVVAHEYFHNWTGDRITCRDWFQLSLKEGLTVFRDQTFSGDMRSHGVQRIQDVRALRARQFPEDAGPLAHPVQPQSYIEINNFYTATIYDKGAEVIGMLRTLVGDEGYRKATDLYFARHDGQATTIENWVKCFEDACGRDLSQFRLWYRQAGTPVVEARGTYDAAARTYTLDLTQTLAPTPGQPDKQPMHIPVRMGLVNAKGAALPLTLEGENDTGPESRVLELTQAHQRFVFVDVAEEPLLSLGRGFSAPAVFRAPHSTRDRAVLVGCDSDAFNRWEAGQILAGEIMLADKTRSDARADYIAAIGEVLNRAGEDPAFAAQMLMPPTESELAAQRTPVDPEAIHAARMALVRAIALAHRDRLAQLYEQMRDAGDFSADAVSAGHRALRNAALRYLTAADDEAAAGLAEAHYRSATNMTDMIAGLAALTRMESPLRDNAFTHFHDRFRGDPLVLDKWMGLQAASPLPDTVASVRALMKHPAFDIRNPNRVRALIGAFSANHLRFHGADGAGYRLLGEVIRALDPLNPQVAARLAGGFESWRRYDASRQALMRAELEAIRGLAGISPNLFEVADKMLGQDAGMTPNRPMGAHKQ
ncbi:MAG: aminopeptidase N [Alphaproteobacteria bacterium 65-7]|nr:MAG: aminopeptidase N [Alphaproteobacteria bacterium 65-7]